MLYSIVVEFAKESRPRRDVYEGERNHGYGGRPTIDQIELIFFSVAVPHDLAGLLVYGSWFPVFLVIQVGRYAIILSIDCSRCTSEVFSPLLDGLQWTYLPFLLVAHGRLRYSKNIGLSLLVWTRLSITLPRTVLESKVGP